MMNMLAIGLVLTTLVTASIWSPSSPPPHHDDHQEVIVKEGHRVVVVEYDKEADGSTKVLISPQDNVVDHTKDPNTEDHEKPYDDDDSEHHGGGVFSGPRELVCDAYGKCKHKIASALGKTKETVTETAHEVSEKAQEIEQQAKKAASGASEQVRETVSGYKERAKQAQKDGKETLSEKVCGNIEGHVGKAKEAVSHGIGKAKKVADDVVGTVKDGASKVKNFDVVDSPIRIGEDIERNVTGKIAEGVEHVKEQAKEVAGQKTFGEILSNIKQVSYDVFWYVLSPNKIDAVVGLLHMLGFSTAYGMCVWVTFVSSYILGRYLPRTQFGMVQSRIYPVYFKAMAYSVGATLLGHLVGQRKEIWSNVIEMFQGLSLFSALLMVLTNMIFLEPKATKLMYERMKIEKEEGRGIANVAKDGVADDRGNTVVSSTTTMVRPTQANVGAEEQAVLNLNNKLKRLNTYSSALNVSTLVVLTWHMAYMGQRLQATR
uniref:uncharacterized protein LOC122590013 n=1 Tax=Erigeron canadensis TaxID=72917 RepID=UPI001CB8AD49|nr:uncharacterized protein LOC122590013 [Erigeron canadensis]